MTVSRYSTGAPALLLPMLAALIGCKNDDSYPVTPPRVLTGISVSVPTTSLELGQTITATAMGFDQNGAPIDVDTVAWSAVDPSIAAVDLRGTVFAVSLGTTEITATVDGKVGRQIITVTPSPAIRINEIFPHDPTIAGWAELFNPTSATVDLSGWTFTDSNIFVELTFPAGASIPPGGYLVIDEASLPFRLDATDAAHLFSRFGVQVDQAVWAIDATQTFGRCPDQPAGFVTLATPTKGAANACPPGGPSLGMRASWLASNQRESR